MVDYRLYRESGTHATTTDTTGIYSSGETRQEEQYTPSSSPNRTKIKAERQQQQRRRRTKPGGPVCTFYVSPCSFCESCCALHQSIHILLTLSICPKPCWLVLMYLRNTRYRRQHWLARSARRLRMRQLPTKRSSAIPFCLSLYVVHDAPTNWFQELAGRSSSSSTVAPENRSTQRSFPKVRMPLGMILLQWYQIPEN